MLATAARTPTSTIPEPDTIWLTASASMNHPHAPCAAGCWAFCESAQRARLPHTLSSSDVDHSTLNEGPTSIFLAAEHEPFGSPIDHENGCQVPMRGFCRPYRAYWWGSRDPGATSRLQRDLPRAVAPAGLRTDLPGRWIFGINGATGLPERWIFEAAKHEPCGLPIDHDNRFRHGPATEDGHSCPSVRSSRTDTSALVMIPAGEGAGPTPVKFSRQEPDGDDMDFYTANHFCRILPARITLTGMARIGLIGGMRPIGPMNKHARPCHCAERRWAGPACRLLFVP